jgi:hypothetical protein
LCDGTRGDCLEVDGIGLGSLDAESFRDMATDAARFWIENAQMLETATACGAYDLEQAGRDFWFSRNGHGVGFFDRGLGEAGDALQAVAEYRETSLYAEPVAGIDPDPDAPDGWTVSLGSRVDPLTDAERATLDALEGEPVAEPLQPVPMSLKVTTQPEATSLFNRICAPNETANCFGTICAIAK